MSTGKIADVFVREMGLTHREFFRTLPSAMGEYSYEIHDTSVIAQLHSGSLLIELAPESVRRIASFAIPKTDVRFVFENVSTDEKQKFINYFDRRFQRGGG